MYKSLQAGRAIAAILVVLFHLGETIAAEKYFGFKAFSIPFSFGNAAGVEFFFVLSGFIILTVHRHDIFNPRELSKYLRKRCIRIYPTYWIIFLSVFLLAIASPGLRNTVPHDAFILLKSLLLIPQDSNVVGGTGAPVIMVAWTLQYEMFFYLCFSLLILSRSLSIIVGLTLLYIYASYSGVSSLSFPLSFLSRDYILLFAMGMIVSVACTLRKVAINKPTVYASVGAVMFLVIALDTVLQVDMIGGPKTIFYGLASSLIIFGFVQAEDKGLIIGGHYWMQILGNSSYALYLIHYPLISILCKLALLIQLNKLGIIGAVISYLSILGACLISSVAFHLWIEKPVTAYFRSRSISPKLIAQQNAPAEIILLSKTKEPKKKMILQKIRLLSIESLRVYMMACARMNKKRFFCNALSGKSAYNISINCDLSVSCNCRDYDGSGHIGSLLRQNLAEIFSGKIAQKFREELSKGRLPILTCARCSELQWVDESEADYYVENYSIPVNGIMVENTIACNLNCLSCARSSVKSTRKKHKMSLDDVKKISQMVHDYSIRCVSFFNLGEPFISENIEAEIEILRAYNPHTTIISATNGQLLDSPSKRRAAMLLDHIIFSINGSTQKSASKYQLGICFDKSYSNLIELIKQKKQLNRGTPVIEWKYVLFNWNDSKYLIARAVELAKQAGVDIISFWPTLSPFYGISLRYFCGNYFKSIGKPSWKGREIDFRNGR